MDSSASIFGATLARRDDHSAVIELAGELDLDSAPQLSTLLDPLVAQGPSTIVIACSGLSFIDSSGLAVLVAAQRRLAERGAQLAVRSLQPQAEKIFATVGLIEFLGVETGSA